MKNESIVKKVKELQRPEGYRNAGEAAFIKELDNFMPDWRSIKGRYRLPALSLFENNLPDHLKSIDSSD